jgi:hypothetical protein
MFPAMIEITMPELERRIHRFEVGEAKLEQLRQMPVGRQTAEQEAIESNLKSTRQELADMRSLHAQLLAGG